MSVSPPGTQEAYFTVPGIDDVPDLYGEVEEPQLVVFFGGNQFMVVPDLVQAFKGAFPQYERVFVETLPPGILRRQEETGALRIGNLRLSIAPDVFTGGRDGIERLQAEKDLFQRIEPYAANRLAIMIPVCNPGGVWKLEDLGRPEVRVSIPNPAWEDIAAAVETALRRAGGEELVEAVLRKKLRDGSAKLTAIHHRETPLRLLRGEADAGPAWHTEGLYQYRIGSSLETVAIPEEHNVESRSVVALCRKAAHRRAAAEFFDFMTSEAARTIFRGYGFSVD